MTTSAKKIKGVYRLSFDLSDMTDGHALGTGNRGETITTYANITGEWVLSSFDDSRLIADNEFLFLANNVLRVKRARLRTPGAEFLRAPADQMFCSRLKLQPCEGGSYDAIPADKMYLYFTRFNEWEEKDVNYFTDKILNRGFQDYSFYIDGGVMNNPTFIAYDDYNVQSAYVGQGFGLYLDLEIDTAGIVRRSDGEVV